MTLTWGRWKHFSCRNASKMGVKNSDDNVEIRKITLKYLCHEKQYTYSFSEITHETYASKCKSYKVNFNVYLFNAFIDVSAFCVSFIDLHPHGLVLLLTVSVQPMKQRLT